MSDDLLNDKGKELANELGLTEEELLGGIKSTQYNLAWMRVDNASLEPEGKELARFKINLGRAYEGMVDALSEALNYSNIQRMANELQSIDNQDAGKLLKAVRILQQIGKEGLVDVNSESRSTPDVYTEDMNESVKLGKRLKEAKIIIESTSTHKELKN